MAISMKTGRPGVRCTTAFSAATKSSTQRTATASVSLQVNAAVTRAGEWTTFGGRWVEADRIVIVQTGELFDGRKGFNRLVFFNISPDRYELRLDACFDSGEPCKENTYSYVAECHRQG